jgi:hypothetical protein
MAEQLKDGDRVVVRRTSTDGSSEWIGRLVDVGEHGFELEGDDGHRHGVFAADPGPGIQQTVTLQD